MMKQGWGLDRNVLRPIPGDPWGIEQHHWNTGAKENQQLNWKAPGKPYSEPTITLNEQNCMLSITCPGSTLSRAVHIDDEVTGRIAKTSVAFGRLRGNVWDRSGIRIDRNLKVYKAVVLPTLLYACETRTVYQRHAKRLFKIIST